MSITHRISTGSTEDEIFQAKVDDAVTDFTGSTIVLLVWNRYGTQVTPVTGTLGWEDAATGKWRYTPDGQLTAALSPYLIRLEITALGKVMHSPNGGARDVWYIVNP